MSGPDGITYTPRAYADVDEDETWSGYLSFIPIVSGPVVATDRQTSAPTLSAVIDWADALTPLELQAALARARTRSRAALLEDEIGRLEQLERDALSDAEALEQDAALDEVAAETARADAERLKRERVRLEADLAGAEERSANVAAAAHEREAEEARAIAGEAKRRRESAERAAASKKPSTH
jgi:hypothetical protein